MILNYNSWGQDCDFDYLGPGGLRGEAENEAEEATYNGENYEGVS